MRVIATIRTRLSKHPAFFAFAGVVLLIAMACGEVKIVRETVLVERPVPVGAVSTVVVKETVLVERPVPVGAVSTVVVKETVLIKETVVVVIEKTVVVRETVAGQATPVEVTRIVVATRVPTPTPIGGAGASNTIENPIVEARFGLDENICPDGQRAGLVRKGYAGKVFAGGSAENVFHNGLMRAHWQFFLLSGADVIWDYGVQLNRSSSTFTSWCISPAIPVVSGLGIGDYTLVITVTDLVTNRAAAAQDVLTINP